MDGVLIDSEPLWREVEREVFGRVGITMSKSELGPPMGCLAVEDPPAGVRSAKAAGMTCVALPAEPSVAGSFHGAGLVLASLEELDGRVWSATGTEPLRRR